MIIEKAKRLCFLDTDVSISQQVNGRNLTMIKSFQNKKKRKRLNDLDMKQILKKACRLTGLPQVTSVESRGYMADSSLNQNRRKRKRVNDLDIKQVLEKARRLTGLPQLTTVESRGYIADSSLNQNRRKRKKEVELDMQQILEKSYILTGLTKKRTYEDVHQKENNGISVDSSTALIRITKTLQTNEVKRLRSIWCRYKDSQNVHKLIACKGFDCIYSSDFLTLCNPEKDRYGDWISKLIHKAWLSENVVNYYMKNCLLEHCPVEGRKYIILPTHFMSQIHQQQQSQDAIHHCSNTYEDFCLTWSEDLEMVIIPIHDKQKHWSLMTLSFKEQHINYFDSCAKTNKKHIKDVMEHLNRVHKSVNFTRWKVHKCPWTKMKQTNCK